MNLHALHARDPFERKLSALSNALSSKVVRRIGRELFDLKTRGDIFFNHPV